MDRAGSGLGRGASPVADDSAPQDRRQGLVLVCGLHNLGWRVAERLHRDGVEVVLADDRPDEALAARAARSGLVVVRGRANDPDVLRAAGAPDATAVLALEEHDLRNIEICLAAQEVRPAVRCVARVVSPQIAAQVAAGPHDISVVDPAALAAPAFAAILGPPPSRPAASTWRVGLTRTGALARRMAAPLAEQTLRRALFVVGCIAAASTAVLSVLYPRHGGPAGNGFGLLDSLYLTVATMATVGFGDFSFARADEWLKAYAVLLMVLGAGSLTVLYACVTNLLLTRRLAELTSRSESSALRGHVVLTGFGSVGLAVAERLIAAGDRVVVVERDEDNRYLSSARALGIMVILGDSTSPAVLARAGLHRARAAAAMTSSDTANVETALTARNVHADAARFPIAIRVFDRDMGERMGRAFALQGVLSVSSVAAPHVVEMAMPRPVGGASAAGP